MSQVPPAGQEATEAALKKYFTLSDKYQKARSARSSGAAMAVLREALGLIDAQYEELERVRRDMGAEEWHPFLNEDTMTLAVVTMDVRTLDLLRRLHRRIRPDVDLSMFAADTEIIARVKAIIKASPGIALADLRKHFSREERVRFRDIRWWMEIHGDLNSAEAKNVRTYGAGRALIPSDRPTLRDGAKAVTPRFIDISAGGVPLGRKRTEDEARDDRPFTTSVGAVANVKLPVECRHRYQVANVIFGGVSWLVSGSTEGLAIEFKDLDGRTTGSASVPILGKIIAEPDVDAVVVVDENLGLTVLDRDASVLLQVGLWNNPEIAIAIRKWRDTSRHAMVRTFSASANKRLVSFSVLDQLFVIDFDGNMVAAHRMPPQLGEVFYFFQTDEDASAHAAERREALEAALTAEGLRAAASREQVGSFLAASGDRVGRDVRGDLDLSSDPWANEPRDRLRDYAGPLLTQWIYYSRITTDGTGAWIGGYSGLLVRVRFDGQVEGSWWLPFAPDSLTETETGAVGVCGARAFVIRYGRDPVVQAVPGLDRGDLIVRGSDRVLWRTGDAYTAVDLAEWSLTTFTATRRKAVYPAGRGYIAESPTSAERWLPSTEADHTSPSHP